MRNFLTAVFAAILILSFQGGLQAQKEVEPPAIPPMLEDKPPLVQLEPKDSETPAKVQESKAKGNAKTVIARKREGSAGLKNKKQTKTTLSGKKKRGKASRKKGVTAKPKPRKNSGSNTG